MPRAIYISWAISLLIYAALSVSSISAVSRSALSMIAIISSIESRFTALVSAYSAVQSVERKKSVFAFKSFGGYLVEDIFNVILHNMFISRTTQWANRLGLVKTRIAFWCIRLS